MKSEQCRKCGALEGQYHIWYCDIERCPFCGGQLNFCDCQYEKLNLIDKKRFPSTAGLHPDIYENGLSDEQETAWRKILEERGRVPFVMQDFTRLCRRCGKRGKLGLDRGYIPITDYNVFYCQPCAELVTTWVDSSKTRIKPTDEELEQDRLHEESVQKHKRPCFFCKHYKGSVDRGEEWPSSHNYICEAFPDGIPDEVLYQEFDHRYPYPNFKDREDNGITFELRKYPKVKPEVHTFESIEDAFHVFSRAVLDEDVFIGKYPDSKHLAAFRYICEHKGVNPDIDESFAIFTHKHYGWPIDFEIPDEPEQPQDKPKKKSPIKDAEQAIGIVEGFLAAEECGDSPLSPMETKAWKYLFTNPDNDLGLKMTNRVANFGLFGVELKPITPVDVLADLITKVRKRSVRQYEPSDVEKYAKYLWEGQELPEDFRQEVKAMAEHLTRSMMSHSISSRDYAGTPGVTTLLMA